MKYICPICDKIVDQKGDEYFKIKTKYTKHFVLVHLKCYLNLKKKGD